MTKALAHAVLGMLLMATLSVASSKEAGSEDAVVSVTVVDPMCYPVPGARVQISGGRIVWSKYADSLGVARFSLPRKARYDIVVTHDVFRPTTRKRVRPERVGLTAVEMGLLLAPSQELVTIE